MPTYQVFSRTGDLTGEQRASVARLLTTLHHEIAEAPRYLVQVIVHDVASDGFYLGGVALEQRHVWIHADIRSGRSPEQRRQLIIQATTQVADLVGLTPEHVWVYLNEIPGKHMTEYGEQLPEPGGEEQWFRSLPQTVQDQLSELG